MSTLLQIYRLNPAGNNQQEGNMKTRQMMPELGIVDIREIIRTLKSEYNFDFGNYALTSFKQRLERIMALYKLAVQKA